LVGFGKHKTVSNVPELPELSHKVQQESFFDRCCHNSWGVRRDSWYARHRTWCEYGIHCCIFHWVTTCLVDGMMMIVTEKRLMVMEDNEWCHRVKCDFCQCWWGWHVQQEWKMPSREWRYKKSIEILSYEGELQFQKKEMLIDALKR
jgi:hypothetical protein